MRRLVVAVSLILISLLAGTIGTAWQAFRASHAARLAQVEARKAARVNQFLQSILISADPNRSRGREVSVRELLDSSAARVHDELSGEPEVEAAVRATIGETYSNLGAYDRAETHLRAALEIRRRVFAGDHADVLATTLALGRVLRDQDRFAEALELIEPAVRRCQQQPRRDESAFGRALMLYADILRYSPDGYAKAERAYRDAIDIFTRLNGPRSAQVANVLGNFGAMQYDVFHFDDAERSLGDAYAIALEVHGADYSTTIMNANNLATILTARGRIDRAAEVSEPALQSALRIFGPQHPETARLLVLVADLYLERGEPDRAEPLARQALAARQQTLPGGHRLINWSRVLLADVLSAGGDAGSAVEAESLALEAIASHEQQGAGGYWSWAEAKSVLGAALAAQGRFQEAESLQCSAIDVIRMGQGARSRPSRNAIRRLIQTYELAGKPELAAEYRVQLASLPPR